ncbi:MAG TPA: WD40 repeat domain-containing protein [Tepidisphaeraceae bacterium]|jgi:WD40 repeat protein|nr:WD40 repeat domain-containing protein [Tepidisphaeraceae bacterium]
MQKIASVPLVLLLILSGGCGPRADDGPKCPPVNRAQKDGIFIWGGNWVNCLTVSTDGRLLAAGMADDSVRLWNIVTGKPRDRIGTVREERLGTYGRLGVHAVAFSPDGSIIAIGHELGTVSLHHAVDGAQFSVLQPRPHGSIKSLAFSADGKLFAVAALAIGEDGSTQNILQIYDCGNMEMLREILLNDAAKRPDLRETKICLGISGDGKRVAAIDSDKFVTVWDTHIGKKLYGARLRSQPASIVVSHDGNIIAWCDESGTVCMLTLSNGKAEILDENAGSNPALRFLAHDSVLAAWGGETENIYKEWDCASAASGKSLKPRFSLPSNRVESDPLQWHWGFSSRALAEDRNGVLLGVLVAVKNGEEGSMIQAWSPTTGTRKEWPHW